LVSLSGFFFALFLKIIEEKFGKSKYYSYIYFVIMIEMRDLKELTRSELEEVLLNTTYTNDLDLANTMMNPRNRYTVLSKIEKYNKIKL
jgi:hypothetical protein